FCQNSFAINQRFGATQTDKAYMWGSHVNLVVYKSTSLSNLAFCIKQKALSIGNQFIKLGG
ncbi:MAG: hypothetical protein PHE96_12970, partial [Methylococcales bacterium]|nr:hypothetical protein [Methylococcales bacterium]